MISKALPLIIFLLKVKQGLVIPPKDWEISPE